MSETGSRRARYERVLEALPRHDEFSLDAAKAACDGERSAFVSRVLGRLEEAGLVERLGPRTRPRFRWLGRGPDGLADWLEGELAGSPVKRSPAGDRPRERLLRQGAGALRLAELFAVLVRSGRPGESALDAGEKLAAAYGERLAELPEAGKGELAGVSAAVRDAAYCQLMAGVELGRRVAAADAAREGATPIRGSADALRYARRAFQRLARESRQESFHLVILDTKHRPTGHAQVSVGSLAEAPVHPREVFRPAVRDAAAAVILVHNHPSGDPTPSAEDDAVTQRLEEAGRILGIPVLDHIVLGHDRAASVREHR